MNEIFFFVLFKKKLSFPEDMVSIRAVEMYLQGEQPTLAKLKIILMDHTGVLVIIFFFFFLSYNQCQEERTKDLFQVFHVHLE